jgi:hypothetical protein
MVLGTAFTTSVTAAEILYGIEVLPAGRLRSVLLSPKQRRACVQKSSGLDDQQGQSRNSMP